MHRKSREGDAGDVYDGGTDESGPTDSAVLRHVVVKRSKAWQVLRHETFFAAKRVPREKRVSSLECLINPDRGLIRSMMCVTYVEKIVAVHACARYRVFPSSSYRSPS